MKQTVDVLLRLSLNFYFRKIEKVFGHSWRENQHAYIKKSLK